MNRFLKIQKLLDLPSNESVINDLSGGQQRRISLAAALISNCSLVILDEPTVGIDLLIIQSIWKYLNIRCREGLTILFVTHYIEEATNANKVGLMRNGKLLAEDNPKKLVDTFGEKSLERVFLRLCLLDNNENNKKRTDSENNEPNEKSEQGLQCYNHPIAQELPKLRPTFNRYKSIEPKSMYECLIFNLWIVLVLIKRNVLKYLHMSTALICILLPATQVVIYCLVYSKPLIEMRAAVFNQELNPEYSEDLLKQLKPLERHVIIPVMYPNLQSAIDAVISGSAVGVIWFKHNFTDSMEERVVNPLDIDPQTIDTSSLHLFMDNSMIVLGNAFIHSLSETVWKFVSNLSQMRNQTNIEIPITVEKTTLSQNLLLKDFGLPANLIFYIYLSQIILSSLVLTQERKDGLFERSLIAGVSHHLVLISHFLTNLLLSIIQIVLMYLTAFIIFSEVNNGSAFLIFNFLMSQALNAITTGLLISSIFKEEYHSLIVVGFFCAPQLFTSGMFWPLESLDTYLRYASLCSPLALPVETMRNIVTRGWTFTNINILFGFAINLIPSLVFFISSLFIFRQIE